MMEKTDSSYEKEKFSERCVRRMRWGHPLVVRVIGMRHPLGGSEGASDGPPPKRPLPSPKGMTNPSYFTRGPPRVTVLPRHQFIIFGHFGRFRRAVDLLFLAVFGERLIYYFRPPLPHHYHTTTTTTPPPPPPNHHTTTTPSLSHHPTHTMASCQPPPPHTHTKAACQHPSPPKGNQ